jgi:hypothetical protein
MAHVSGFESETEKKGEPSPTAPAQVAQPPPKLQLKRGPPRSLIDDSSVLKHFNLLECTWLCRFALDRMTSRPTLAFWLLARINLGSGPLPVSVVENIKLSDILGHPVTCEIFKDHLIQKKSEESLVCAFVLPASSSAPA